MTNETRKKLLDAWQFCDDEDKSNEYMIQHMQDYAGVSFDTVMKFIKNTTIEERMNHVSNNK